MLLVVMIVVGRIKCGVAEDLGDWFVYFCF